MYVEYSGAERPQRHRSSTRVPLGEYVLLASPWPVGMTTHGSEGGVLRTPYSLRPTNKCTFFTSTFYV
jgi:hypothetical protein